MKKKGSISRRQVALAARERDLMQCIAHPARYKKGSADRIAREIQVLKFRLARAS